MPNPHLHLKAAPVVPAAGRKAAVPRRHDRTMSVPGIVKAIVRGIVATDPAVDTMAPAVPAARRRAALMTAPRAPACNSVAPAQSSR